MSCLARKYTPGKLAVVNEIHSLHCQLKVFIRTDKEPKSGINVGSSSPISKWCQQQLKGQENDLDAE